jgi:hypothetical protein
MSESQFFGIEPNVHEPGLDGAIIRADAVLHDYSVEERVGLLDKLDAVLEQWAQENGYTPASYRTGLTTMQQWLPPPGAGPAKSPIGNQDLVTGHLIPQEYPPFHALLGRICPDPELALSMVFALLLLREAASGNREGVTEAVRAMDKASSHIQSLARQGHRTLAGRRKGGMKGAEARIREAHASHQKIVSIAEGLLKQGHKPHQLARIIAKRMTISDKTVRRVLQANGILKKRTPTKHGSI